MGACVGGKGQASKDQKNQKDQKDQKDQNHNHAAPPPGRTDHVEPIQPPPQVHKLTVAEIAQKRANMKASLEEGHSNPPVTYAPRLAPVTNIN